MTEKGPSIIDWSTLIAALVGGGLLTFIVSTLYSDVIDKPYLSINFDNHSKTFEITNIGRAAATHLVLTINSSEMPSITLMTENATTTAFKVVNLDVWELQVPRLSSGGWSVIDIGVSVNNKSPQPTLYASYDQGSNRNNTKISKSPLFLPIFISSILAALTFVYLYLHKTRKYMKYEHWFLCKIKFDVDNIADKKFGVTETLTDKLYSFNLWKDHSINMKQKMLEIQKDKGSYYEDIESFYTFIDIRDIHLKDKVGGKLQEDYDEVMRKASCLRKSSAIWAKDIGLVEKLGWRIPAIILGLGVPIVTVILVVAAGQL